MYQVNLLDTGPDSPATEVNTSFMFLFVGEYILKARKEFTDRLSPEYEGGDTLMDRGRHKWVE